MRITYDRVADAVYIYLVDKIGRGQVHKTYCCNPIEVKGQINLHFDKSARLLGIEVLDARSKLSDVLLEAAEIIA